MASKDPKMNKQGAAGKRKHVTLRNPQKLENTEGDPDAPNQQLKEISKWNTPLTTYAAHI
jgi:hypothetical protein